MDHPSRARERLVQVAIVRFSTQEFRPIVMLAALTGQTVEERLRADLGFPPCGPEDVPLELVLSGEHLRPVA